MYFLQRVGKIMTDWYCNALQHYKFVPTLVTVKKTCTSCNLSTYVMELYCNVWSHYSAFPSCITAEKICASCDVYVETWRDTTVMHPGVILPGLVWKKLERWFFAFETKRSLIFCKWPRSYGHAKKLHCKKRIYIPQYVSRKLTGRYCNALECRKYLYLGIGKDIHEEMIL